VLFGVAGAGPKEEEESDVVDDVVTVVDDENKGNEASFVDVFWF
jgi:hypothetical protein